MRYTHTCLLLVLIASQDVAAQSGINDRPVCERCSLEVGTVVTFGEADGPGIIAEPPDNIRVDGRGRIWVLSYNDPPRVFSAGGKFIGVVGRPGKGPGEFSGSWDAIPLPGDSMLVIDNGLMRATVVSPDLRPVRSVSFPFGQITTGIPLSWPHRTVVNAIIYLPDYAGWQLHLVDFSGVTATISRSFGPNGGELRPGNPAMLVSKISTPIDGPFWSTEKWRYNLTQWTREGSLTARLPRNIDWFPPTARGSVGGPASPPDPHIGGVQEDSSGLVWVMINVPAPDWKAGWPDMDGSRGEIETRMIRIDRLYRSIVEIIDPKRRAVVTRQPIGGLVLSALPENRTAVYSTSSEGIPKISIVQLRLVNR